MGEERYVIVGKTSLGKTAAIPHHYYRRKNKRKWWQVWKKKPLMVWIMDTKGRYNDA